MIARALDSDPEVESVLGLDIAEPKAGPRKLRFVKADVRTADFSVLLQGIDAVFHLAFIVEPPKKMTIRQIDEINVEGSRRVFVGAAAAGVRKIIYSSSVAAYGAHADNPVPLVEDSPLRPNADWYYSRTKGAAEAFLDELQKNNPELTIIRFRPSVFLGPTNANVVGRMLSQRVVFSMFPNLKIDLCWDEDIAEAFRLALRCDRSDAFNLAGDGPITAVEAGRLLNRRVISLSPAWVVPICRLLSKVGIVTRPEMDWVEVSMKGPILVSSEKAKQVLGWKPRHDAAQTLVRFVKGVIPSA